MFDNGIWHDCEIAWAEFRLERDFVAGDIGEWTCPHCGEVLTNGMTASEYFDAFLGGVNLEWVK